MIIPTLVLVSAMQFGDPQSGARIDDLSNSPWREVPVVMPVSYTAQSNDTPEESLEQPTVPNMSTPPSIQAQGTLPPSGMGYRGVPDPDLAGGIEPASTMRIPQSEFVSQSTASQRSTPNNGLSHNGSSHNGSTPNGLSGSTSYLLMQTNTDYGGTTKIENNKVYLSRANVKFDKIARLSAPIGGIVLEQRTEKRDIQGNVMKGSDGKPIMIDLERGVLVFTGQQVAQLDDRYPQKQYTVSVTKLNVARKEAAQTIGIDYAEASYQVADSDLRRSLGIAKRTPAAVTDQELEVKTFKVKEARLQWEKANIDHENQQESVKIQEDEVEVAQTQLDLRKVKTPFNGMVVNVVSQVGNYLREGEAIAEVAQLDKLKVIASVDGNMITQEQVDKKRVTVTVKNPGGQIDEFDGFVRYAAPSFKDQRREFEVEIEVDNRLVNGYWLLKEGDFVEVVIHL